MSNRDELNAFMKENCFGSYWYKIFDMAIATAKEESLAEIMAELDARLDALAPPPSGDACGPAPASDRITEQDIDTLYRIAKDPTATKGRLNFVPEKVQSRGPAPGVDRITVSSQMADIVAAEATIDGKRYTMRGMPPPGARSVVLYHEDGPAPVPCPDPFSWCGGCGRPLGRGHEDGCYWLYIQQASCDGQYISCPPYTGGPAPSPDTAPAAEPPSSAGGLEEEDDKLDALRSWIKMKGVKWNHTPLIDDHAEIRRLRDALREIRYTPIKVAGSDSIIVGRMREIAARALDE